MDPLPPAFVQNVVGYFPNGRRWLADLPQRLAALEKRWRLRELRPVASLSFNFVAFATESRHGREVVLKVSPDPSVTAAESAWLLHHAGKAVVGVLAASPDAYLMECLSPGLPLDPQSQREDRQTAREIASLVHRLSRSPPPADQAGLFRAVAQDSSGFADYSRAFGDRGAVDAKLVDAAKTVWSTLVASPLAPVPCSRRLAPRQRARVRARRRDIAADCHRPARVDRRDRIRVRRDASKPPRLVPERGHCCPCGIRSSGDPGRDSRARSRTHRRVGIRANGAVRMLGSVGDEGRPGRRGPCGRPRTSAAAGRLS